MTPSLISYGECLHVVEREQGLQQAQRTVGIVDQLAVRVVPADRSLVFAAAHLKARYSISYADAFSAGLAKRYAARVMTDDPEFRAIESEVPIRWLPEKHRL